MRHRCGDVGCIFRRCHGALIIMVGDDERGNTDILRIGLEYRFMATTLTGHRLGQDHTRELFRGKVCGAVHCRDRALARSEKEHGTGRLRVSEPD